MSQRATLFKEKEQLRQQLLTEAKYYLLHYHFLRLKNLFEAWATRSDVPNRFEQFTKQFERALIIASSVQTINLGEAYVTIGYKNMCELLDEDEIPGALAELGIAEPDQTINFNSLYLTTQHQLQSLMNTRYQADTHDTFAEVILTLARCKAFTTLKNILDKIPQDALLNLKHVLDIAFFYTIHFGNDEMMEYLLNRGVSPQVIDTQHPEKKQMPLVLLLQDLQRFMHRMQKRVQHARDGKLIVGSLADLERIFDARMHAYHNMISDLLVRGADPDQLPDETFTHTTTPRQTAQAYMDTLIPALVESDFHFKDKAEVLIAILQLMTSRPLPEIALQPIEKRQKI